MNRTKRLIATALAIGVLATDQFIVPQFRPINASLVDPRPIFSPVAPGLSRRTVQRVNFNARPEICKVGAANMPWFKGELKRETDPAWLAYAQKIIYRAVMFQAHTLDCHLKEQVIDTNILARRNGGPLEKQYTLLSWHGWEDPNAPLFPTAHTRSRMVRDWVRQELKRQDVALWVYQFRNNLADESSVDACLRFDKGPEYHFGVETGALAGLTLVAGFYDATQSGTGTTWYVSDTDGSDTNTGASSTPGATGPFKTWAHADDADRRTIAAELCNNIVTYMGAQ